jgi:hypothetical protein
MARKQSIITPTVEPSGMVYYGTNGLNVDSFGISSDSYLEIHHKIVSKGLRVRQPTPVTQIRFVLCRKLLQRDSGGAFYLW